MTVVGVVVFGVGVMDVICLGWTVRLAARARAGALLVWRCQ